MTANPYLMALLSVACTALAQVTLKHAMSQPAVQASLAAGEHRALLLALTGAPWLWIGGALFGVGLAGWLLVLARLDVSVAYGFVSLGIVFTSCLAFFMLGESLTMPKFIGFALILAGIMVVSRG